MLTKIENQHGVTMVDTYETNGLDLVDLLNEIVIIQAEIELKEIELSNLGKKRSGARAYAENRISILTGELDGLREDLIRAENRLRKSELAQAEVERVEAEISSNLPSTIESMDSIDKAHRRINPAFQLWHYSRSPLMGIDKTEDIYKF